MSLKLRTAVAITFLSASSFNVYAIDYRFSGFGTLGYGQLDAEKGTSFRGDTTSGGFNNHSLIGGQIDVNLVDNLDFTIQGKVSEDLEVPDRMSGSLEMAFLAYQVTEELRFRVGRMRTPLYLNSEFLDVGYAQTAATRADAVYAQMPFNYFDGVDLIYSKYFGNYELVVHPFYGTSELESARDIPNGDRITGTIKMNWMAGINIAFSGDFWKLRVGYNQGNVDDQARDKAISSLTNSQLALNGLPSSAYPLVESSVESSYDKNTFNNDDGTFSTIGFSYDDLFILQTEVAHRTVKDALGFADVTGAYATLGKRFGSATPYATVQISETANKNKEAGFNNDFTAFGVGLRYDINRVALKAEATRFDFGKYDGSYNNYYTNQDVKNLTRFVFVIDTVF